MYYTMYVIQCILYMMMDILLINLIKITSITTIRNSQT